MKPLSRTKRRIYLIFFALVFVVSLPLVILYARGYRLTLSEALKFGRTGGFYIAATQSGAEIYIDSKLVKKTGIFQKNVLVQNLKPGSYDIKVVKDGFHTWTKTLSVFSETVTEAHPFMLPENPELVEVPPYLSDSGMPTSTPPKASLINTLRNPEYIQAAALFSVASSKETALKSGTSTEILGIQRKLSVENRDGRLYIEWLGKSADIPSYFCQYEQCKSSITLAGLSAVKVFDFYPGRGDLLIIAVSDGIYVAEMDDRSAQNIQPLFPGKNLDFRIDGDVIFIKQAKRMYFLSL
ncbi:PEGA domain-containing protein [Patescibacteria group bacterium]|nr:MAG: PEGA domain-containing protein [Patescibacteria group bacterium]